MKAITLRDLPASLAKQIEDRAKRDRMSLNKTVIAMLSESSRRRYHDLDHLAGCADQEEREELDRLIQEQRTIDPEMWE